MCWEKPKVLKYDTTVVHYCPLHLSQIPFTTKFTFSETNPSGTLIWGILCSVKQMVSLQLLQ